MSVEMKTYIICLQAPSFSRTSDLMAHFLYVSGPCFLQRLWLYCLHINWKESGSTPTKLLICYSLRMEKLVLSVSYLLPTYTKHPVVLFYWPGAAREAQVLLIERCWHWNKLICSIRFPNFLVSRIEQMNLFQCQHLSRRRAKRIEPTHRAKNMLVKRIEQPGPESMACFKKTNPLWSWSFSRLTGSRIRASWWHVRKMMTSFLSSTWTSHGIPILKMQMQWRPWLRHLSMEVSNVYIYW